MKKVVVGAAVTVSVYDATGKLVAEYGVQAQVSGRDYVTQDLHAPQPFLTRRNHNKCSQRAR